MKMNIYTGEVYKRATRVRIISTLVYIVVSRTMYVQGYILRA